MDCSSFYSGKLSLLVAGKILCIETGRWHRPIQKPISERICDACTT